MATTSKINNLDLNMNRNDKEIGTKLFDSLKIILQTFPDDEKKHWLKIFEEFFSKITDS
jgi:hypothetical protein